MIRVVQRRPSVVRTQNRATCKAKNTASQNGATGADHPNSHNRLVVPRGGLVGTLGQQIGGVAAGEPQFAQPLHRNQRKERDGEGHAVLRRETQLAVKPGPIAVSSVRAGMPSRMTRSNTNSAVGADMLPYSARTARS